MYLTVDSLTDINKIVACSNNIIFMKDNVKPSGRDNMYKDKDFIENKLYQSLDPFIERIVNHR